MHQTPCRLLGEIRYPDEYSYERVGEIESVAGEALAEALSGLDVAHLEVSPGPEALCFEVWCESCPPEEGAAVCESLLAIMDDGPLGRLVVVRGADAPITVYYYSGESLDEVTVDRP
jgi:hypothetical protein